MAGRFTFGPTKCVFFVVVVVVIGFVLYFL